MADPSPSLEHDVPNEADASAFLAHAYLTYILPYDTDVDIGEVVKAAIADKKPLEELESRTWLFFGMAILRPGANPEVLPSHNTHL